MHGGSKQADQFLHGKGVEKEGKKAAVYHTYVLSQQIS